MGLKQLEDVTYFRLNNEINRPINGQIMLHKDKEALEAFFKENVEPNTKKFSSITEKIHYLIQENYLEKEFIQLYSPEYIDHVKSLGFNAAPVVQTPTEAFSGFQPGKLKKLS